MLRARDVGLALYPGAPPIPPPALQAGSKAPRQDGDRRVGVGLNRGHGHLALVRLVEKRQRQALDLTIGPTLGDGQGTPGQIRDRFPVTPEASGFGQVHKNWSLRIPR